jgi:hypothetical protein
LTCGKDRRLIIAPVAQKQLRSEESDGTVAANAASCLWAVQDLREAGFMQVEGVVEQSLAQEQTEMCASCGRAIGRLEQPFIWGEKIVCFGCHRHLSGHHESDTVGERVFLSGRQVKITNRRVSLGGRHFDLAQIRFARMHTAPARRWIGGLLCAAGVIVALCGLGRTIAESDVRLLLPGAALAMLGLMAVLLLRPRYSIILTTAEADHVAIRTRNRRYANQLLDAVAMAIVERGQSHLVEPGPMAGGRIQAD